MHARRSSAATAIAVALCGCGYVSLTPAAAPASAEQLAGPWRPVPLLIGAGTREETDAACRADPDLPSGLTLVAIDARGAGRLLVQYAEPDGSPSAVAEATLGVDEPTTCRVTSSRGTGVALPLSDRELRWGEVSAESGLETEAWAMVTGRAGPAIEQVVAEVPGSPRITGTLADGWFAFWWPGEAPGPVRVVGLDAGGAEIAELEGR